ncbi:MAG: hypothetical protein Q9213_003148 [Squamulea squamosa]
MILLNSIALVLSFANVLYQCTAVRRTIHDIGRPLSRHLLSITNLNTVATVNGDEGFSIEIVGRRGSYVNPFVLLLNAVDALAIVGLKDTKGRTVGTHFQLTKYPTVIIDVQPIGSADVVNWYLSLCIYYGVEQVIRRQAYQEITISCAWNDVEMVRVIIRTVSSDIRKVTTASGSNTTEPTSAVFNTLRPRFFYVRNALALDYSIVMITLMYSIMYLSRLSKTAVVPQTYADPGPHWDACIIFPGDGPSPSRDHPPFLECRWVIESLSMIPNFMIQQRRFAELGIAFQVDNKILGSGLLQKGKPYETTASRKPLATATV